MIIVAKYPSTCPACVQRIHVGERVHWSRGEKAIHATCKPHDKAASAKDRTLSLFDQKTDMEREPWQGRDGSFGTQPKKPRSFRSKGERKWEPNRFAPGIPDRWEYKYARVDWEKSSHRFHVYLSGVHVHTSDTVTEAIQFAEREMESDSSDISEMF